MPLLLLLLLSAAASGGGGRAEDGVGKKARIRGVKKVIGSGNGQNKKAKEDNTSKCNNCQEKYVEASVGWVGCSFCDTWYAKIVKGVLRFTRRSVQQIPINKIKSIRPIKYI